MATLANCKSGTHPKKIVSSLGGSYIQNARSVQRPGMELMLVKVYELKLFFKRQYCFKLSSCNIYSFNNHLYQQQKIQIRSRRSETTIEISTIKLHRPKDWKCVNYLLSSSLTSHKKIVLIIKCCIFTKQSPCNSARGYVVRVSMSVWKDAI